MEHISNDMVNIAWNVFGLTGGVEEYLMYRDIKKKCELEKDILEKEQQSLYNTNKITAKHSP